LHTFASNVTETLIEKEFPGAVLLSKFTSDTIQDGGCRHLEIHIIGYNAIAIPLILTSIFRLKMESQTEL